MKKSIKIIIGIIVVLLISYIIIFIVDYIRCANLKMPIFVKKGEEENTYYGLGYKVQVEKQEDTLSKVEMYMFNKFISGAIAEIDVPKEEQIEKDKVIIEYGNIKNEHLINEFIKVNEENLAEERTLEIIDGKETILIKCVPGEYDKNKNDPNTTVEIRAVQTSEEYQKYYGYYELIKSEKIEKFDKARWSIRKKVENDKIQLYFYTYMELAEIPLICEYNLKDSEYKQKFQLSYYQEKHMGIEEIAKIGEFDNEDFGVYTFGGDVLITIEGDMVYNLKDALQQKVITTNDLLEYIKLDAEYGICEECYYYDGGSIEYIYLDFTVLKYNTVDGNKDLIIGGEGSIINTVNKIEYK